MFDIQWNPSNNVNIFEEKSITSHCKCVVDNIDVSLYLVCVVAGSTISHSDITCTYMYIKEL